MPKSSILTRFRKPLNRKSTRRRIFRVSLVALNAILLIAVAAFVLLDPARSTGSAAQSLVSTDDSQLSSTPLDHLTALNIARTVSTMTDLPETPLVNGQLVAEKVQLSTNISVADSRILTKPQVVKTDFKSNQDIKTYTVVVGDTVSKIARKFGISSDSVRWSNNLTGEAVNAGTRLKIPPVNGIVYKVKSGDTPASLAQTYSTGKDLIIAYNDAEIKGLKVGELILIPGGRKPMPTYYGYGLNYGASYGYGTAGVAGNYSLYDRNNCTWWVALRWAETGRPIMPLLGNASQWYWNAKANGLRTGVGVPKAHAAAVTSTAGYGHVVFVESVNADGSINISEMNVDGWASSRVWRSTIPASTAANYLYIY